MKNILATLFFASLAAGSAMASETHQDSELFSQLVQINEAVRSSGWDYLGCASNKETCAANASSRGYSESKLVYMTCTPRDARFSCFAK
jgi:hypothetical protein